MRPRFWGFCAYTIKKGKVYKAGNYKYQIPKANVSATVNIRGKSFQVTEFGAGVFSGCRKVASAALGANVAKIGGKAFTP